VHIVETSVEKHAVVEHLVNNSTEKLQDPFLYFALTGLLSEARTVKNYLLLTNVIFMLQPVTLNFSYFRVLCSLNIDFYIARWNLGVSSMFSCGAAEWRHL
jgi:hypothetical protein